MFSEAYATFIIALVMSQSPESLNVTLNEYVCMIEAIHYEARGEPRKGKEAVASVILNRVESRRYPDTICEVVEQTKQFSYRNGKDDVAILAENKIEGSSLKESAEVAFAAVNGKLKDRTSGSNHYYAHNTVTPFWAEDVIPRAIIGNHTFLKL